MAVKILVGSSDQHRPFTTTLYQFGQTLLAESGVRYWIQSVDSFNASMCVNLVGGMIRQTDVKGNDTVHGYDSFGRRSSVTDWLNHTTTFAYTVLGQLESLTDAESQTTSYRYDGYGRQNRVTWPDHVPGDLGYGITTTEHDDLDRVTRTTDQLGDTVTMSYDAAGRMLGRDYRTRANSPLVVITDAFTFDDASRIMTPKATLCSCLHHSGFKMAIRSQTGDASDAARRVR